METALLSTKLFVPSPRPGLVNRPRLIERLDAALNNPFTLVSAPAGFGKTTVLAQWIAGIKARLPVAWVSLDEGDNDPVRFWDYFIAAASTVRPGAGESASLMLHSPQPYPMQSVLTALINQLAFVESDFVVVLDDYHLIQGDSIHQNVAFAIEHLPEKMHVAIATRADPDLPLARLRGRGALLEIRAEDLRFSSDEATALLQRLVGTEVSPEHVNALQANTEGWAAGLKMAGLSMRGRSDPNRFVTSFSASNRYVMDYLLEEVLERQPNSVRDFLLKTSVLDRLTGPLCDWLVGNETGGQTLEELDESNLFLVQLDDVGQWYRYHHLFADLLRHQLETAYGIEEVNRMHRLASEWFEHKGPAGESIGHAIQARDWQRATRLIENNAEDLVKRGEWNSLLGWFQAIPDEELRTHPLAYSQYANVLTTAGKLEAAEAVLAYLESAPSLGDRLGGQLSFFRMGLAYHRGDVKLTTQLAQRALEQLGDENEAMRARALHILAVFDMSAGRLGLAQSREVEALEAARRIGESWVGATATGNLSLILWLRGRLRDALRTAQEAVDMTGQSPAASGPR